MRSGREICRCARAICAAETSSGARSASCGVQTAPGGLRAGVRVPCGRDRSAPQGARRRHRKRAQDPDSTSYSSCSAAGTTAWKNSGSDNRLSRTTFRNNRQQVDGNSDFEPIKTSRFDRILKWALVSIVDCQPGPARATEPRLQPSPRPAVSPSTRGVLFDADPSSALLSVGGAQRRGDGFASLAMGNHSCDWLPPCGDAQVLYFVIERLVGEFVASLDAGVPADLSVTRSRSRLGDVKTIRCGLTADLLHKFAYITAR